MIPEAGDRHGQLGMIYPTPRPATFSFYHLLMAWKGDVRGVVYCFALALHPISIYSSLLEYKRAIRRETLMFGPIDYAKSLRCCVAVGGKGGAVGVLSSRKIISEASESAVLIYEQVDHCSSSLAVSPSRNRNHPSRLTRSFHHLPVDLRCPTFSSSCPQTESSCGPGFRY